MFRKKSKQTICEGIRDTLFLFDSTEERENYSIQKESINDREDLCHFISSVV